MNKPTEQEILQAKIALDDARLSGDQLKIDLAENALNELLDRANVTVVTRHKEDQ